MSVTETDYAAIERRILFHMTSGEKDIYSALAADMYSPTGRITEGQRTLAKSHALSAMYGKRDTMIYILDLVPFLRESLGIEGIHRNPTDAEMNATRDFLEGDCSVYRLRLLQAVYAPHCPLRDRAGMNVRVGSHIAPPGGPDIELRLTEILTIKDPWHCHVAFETLHPFMDGNGRSGRTVWAWKMLQAGRDPFALSFLHRFYYDTLAHHHDK